jgi:hypothetical protein
MEREWWDCKHRGTVGNVEGVGGVWGTEANDDVWDASLNLYDWTCASSTTHTESQQKSVLLQVTVQ